MAINQSLLPPVEVGLFGYPAGYNAGFSARTFNPLPTAPATVGQIGPTRAAAAAMATPATPPVATPRQIAGRQVRPMPPQQGVMPWGAMALPNGVNMTAPAQQAQKPSYGLSGQTIGHGLIGLGAGLMQAAAPSTDPRSGSLGNALGVGLQGMYQGLNQGMQLDEYRRQRRDRERQMREQERMRLARERLVSNLSPEERTMFEMAPEEFAKRYIENRFERPETPGGKDIFSIEKNLYDDFRKQVDPSLEQINAYRSAEAILADPTTVSDVQQIKDAEGKVIASIPADALQNADTAADIALVFAFMKAQDPRSTVREGEFQLASDVGGLSQSVAAFFSKISGEGRLTPTQRRELLRQIRNQYNSAVSNIQSVRASALSRAQQYEDPAFAIDPNRAIPMPNIYVPRLNASFFSPAQTDPNSPDGMVIK